jgi:hypothetical protein
MLWLYKHSIDDSTCLNNSSLGTKDLGKLSDDYDTKKIVTLHDYKPFSHRAPIKSIDLNEDIQGNELGFDEYLKINKGKLYLDLQIITSVHIKFSQNNI